MDHFDRDSIARAFGEVWAEHTERILKAEAEAAMGSHRADDGRYMGAAYEPAWKQLAPPIEPDESGAWLTYKYEWAIDECPQCKRPGRWIMQYGADRYWCAGCGFWPIPNNSASSPIAKTTDPTDTPPTPIDVMKATVDSWTDEQRSAAYKYLHVAYKQRL